MAYQTYTTEALVCGTQNRNTADRSYLLFTRDAGMVFADARSVREERSRQRYALQDFSLVRVSLVKGKRGWKIGSIESLKNFYHDAADKTARGSVVSVFRHLRRFVRGEEPAEDLFTFTTDALIELATSPNHTPFTLLVVQVRILSLLGYVDDKSVPESIQHVEPKAIAARYEPSVEKRVEALYTHAVSVSHL